MRTAFRAGPIGAFIVLALAACAATPDIVYGPAAADAGPSSRGDSEQPADASSPPASDAASATPEDAAPDVSSTDATPPPDAPASDGASGADADTCKAAGEKCTSSSECCQGQCQGEDESRKCQEG